MFITCVLSLNLVMFFSQEVFVPVLSYFSLAEASHDVKLAYRSVRAHTLLSVNNQSFRKTSFSRQTSVECKDYNVAVVVVFHEEHGRGMYKQCKPCLLPSFAGRSSGAIQAVVVGHRTSRRQHTTGCPAAEQFSVACLQRSVS